MKFAVRKIQPGKSNFDLGLIGELPGDRVLLAWVGRIEISLRLALFIMSGFRHGLIVRIGGVDMCGAGFGKRIELGSGVLRFEHWDAYRGGERNVDSAVLRGGDNDLIKGGGDRKGESKALPIGDCSMGSRDRAG